MEFRGTLFHPNGSRSRHENFVGLFLGSICFLFCDFAAFGKLTWRVSRVFPNRANHQKGTFQQMMRIPRVVQLNCPMNFTKWKGAELLALPWIFYLLELFLLSLPAVSKLFLLFSSFPVYTVNLHFGGCKAPRLRWRQHPQTLVAWWWVDGESW
jgi:hypothetical protein